MVFLSTEVMGSTVYGLFKEENGKESYGISVQSDVFAEEIHSVSTVYDEAYSIYETLIRNAVSPLHTKYVITDLICC